MTEQERPRTARAQGVSRADLLAIERHARVVTDAFGEWWADEDDGGDVEQLVKAMNRLRRSLDRVSRKRAAR